MAMLYSGDERPSLLSSSCYPSQGFAQARNFLFASQGRIALFRAQFFVSADLVTIDAARAIRFHLTFQ